MYGWACTPSFEPTIPMPACTPTPHRFTVGTAMGLVIIFSLGKIRIESRRGSYPDIQAEKSSLPSWIWVRGKKMVS